MKFSDNTMALKSDYHIRWQPNPRNQELRRRNAANLKKLLHSGRITAWEDGYCKGLTKNPRLAPEHQALLDMLVKKYLKQGDDNANTTKQ